MARGEQTVFQASGLLTETKGPDFYLQADSLSQDSFDIAESFVDRDLGLASAFNPKCRSRAILLTDVSLPFEYRFQGIFEMFLAVLPELADELTEDWAGIFTFTDYRIEGVEPEISTELLINLYERYGFKRLRNTSFVWYPNPRDV